MADAHWRAGRIQKGLELLDEACLAVEKTGERLFEADILRLRGVLLLDERAVQDDRFQEVESCFRQAIAIAKRQQAKVWELRATTDLSRLLIRLGKRVEAKQCLASIYGWFSEGFDAPDLVVSKKLLDEMDSVSSDVASIS